MLKRDVKIGGFYAAKVSERVVPIHLVGESRFGGWDATNVKTGRAIRIKSAAKLRFEVEPFINDAGVRRWRRVA